MLAVSDTGPLLHLSEANLLELLHLLGEVHAPQQVLVELSFLAPDWQIPFWLTIDTLDAFHVAEAFSWMEADMLDPGEAEAVALAQQIGAEKLLTDDLEARLFAGSLGIEVHGSLGVVLWAARRGYLDSNAAFAALDRLNDTSLWLSKRILAEARDALTEIFQSRSQ